MKYVAAALLVELGGNTPSKTTIKDVLEAVDCEIDDAKLKEFLDKIDGKSLQEMVASGMGKLSSVPTGGAVAASGGGGDSGKAEKEEVKEEVKEEEEEESDDDMGFGLFD
ncbi:large ribosomal subunit protein P2-like [Convolutriloba macropyga]|uniref:large ribosomal subunit protein P2-like n=1 Tax=Convolutriloba macropyga TaxID=536237 RepID=UPI003F5238C7